MLKLINMLYFKGWTKREKVDFLISLFLTIVFCVAMIYLASNIQAERPQHLDLRALTI